MSLLFARQYHYEKMKAQANADSKRKDPSSASGHDNSSSTIHTTPKANVYPMLGIKRKIDELAQEDTSDILARLHGGLDSLEKRIETKKSDPEDAKKKFRESQAKTRTLKKQVGTLEDKLQQQDLTSKVKTAELELKVSELEFKLAEFDKYKREAEVPVQLSNTYRDRLAREKAEAQELQATLKARDDTTPEVFKSTSDAVTQTLNALAKEGKLPKIDKPRNLHLASTSTVQKSKQRKSIYLPTHQDQFDDSTSSSVDSV